MTEWVNFECARLLHLPPSDKQIFVCSCCTEKQRKSCFKSLCTPRFISIPPTHSSRVFREMRRRSVCSCSQTNHIDAHSFWQPLPILETVGDLLWELSWYKSITLTTLVFQNEAGNFTSFWLRIVISCWLSPQARKGKFLCKSHSERNCWTWSSFPRNVWRPDPGTVEWDLTGQLWKACCSCGCHIPCSPFAIPSKLVCHNGP